MLTAAFLVLGLLLGVLGQAGRRYRGGLSGLSLPAELRVQRERAVARGAWVCLVVGGLFVAFAVARVWVGGR